MCVGYVRDVIIKLDASSAKLVRGREEYMAVLCCAFRWDSLRAFWERKEEKVGGTKAEVS